MKIKIVSAPSGEIVLDKKDLWKMITSCGVPFSLGNSHCPGIPTLENGPTYNDESWRFGWNPSFKYGKHWTVEYMWKLYVAIRTLHAPTWEDVDGIDPDAEIEIPMKVRVKTVAKEGKA